VSSQYLRTYSRTYWKKSSGEAVVWAGVCLGEELVEVVARQHKLPIGAQRRRSSSDEARWTSANHNGVWLVVTPDNISWPTRDQNVDATIGSTMRSGGGLRAMTTGGMRHPDLDALD
jgi:hypothetical protein